MKKLREITNIWSRLAVILSKKNKRTYASIVIFSFIGAILEIVGVAILLHTMLSILKPEFIQHNVLTSFVYNQFEIEDNRTFIIVMSSFLLFLYVLKNVLLVQINKIQVRKAYEITDEVSDIHFKSVINRGLLYFKRHLSADIMNGLSNTSLNFADSILMPSIIWLSEVLVVILMLGAMFFYNPMLFFFSAVTLIPSAGILIYMNRKTLRDKGTKINEVLPKAYENISEMTNGISNIKLWDGSSFFYNRYTRLKREIYEYKESIYVNSNFIPVRIYEVIAISGILCVVLYGILSGTSNSTIISFISIYAGVSFKLLPSINRIIAANNQLSIFSYLFDYFKKEDPRYPKEPQRQGTLTFKSKIELKDICFGYEDSQILQNLNLTVQKGDFIGIIGESGTGKSTLVNVLASLISPDQGGVFLDGKEITPQDFGAYRFLFSYVRQDVFMLNATILENVAFLDAEPDEQRVRTCLEKVNLGKWIESLDDDVNTMVGELGKRISGGQKQRIAIARALYKEAEIFIFDEVTNNLDTYSSEQTLNAIQALKEEGRSAIFITHKEEELKMCNKVYSLVNQQLVERK